MAHFKVYYEAYIITFSYPKLLHKGLYETNIIVFIVCVSICLLYTGLTIINQLRICEKWNKYREQNKKHISMHSTPNGNVGYILTIHALHFVPLLK